MCRTPAKNHAKTRALRVSKIQQDKFFSGIPPLASGALENQKAGGLCYLGSRVRNRGILMNFRPCSETCGKFKHIENDRRCEVSSSLSAPKLFFLMSESQRSTVRIAHSKCPANYWHRRRSSILTQGQIALLHTLCQWEMLQDVMVFTMVLLVTWWFTPVSGFCAQFSV